MRAAQIISEQAVTYLPECFAPTVTALGGVIQKPGFLTKSRFKTGNWRQKPGFSFKSPILTKNAAEKVDRLFESSNKGVDFLASVVEIQTGASGRLGA